MIIVNASVAFKWILLFPTYVLLLIEKVSHINFPFDFCIWNTGFKAFKHRPNLSMGQLASLFCILCATYIYIYFIWYLLVALRNSVNILYFRVSVHHFFRIFTLDFFLSSKIFCFVFSCIQFTDDFINLMGVFSFKIIC